MRSLLRLALCLFALALHPQPASALITIDDGGQDTPSGGPNGGDPTDDNGNPVDLHDSIAEFEKRGYTCSASSLADVQCSACFPHSDGTQTCDDYFCLGGSCDSHSSRDGIPQNVDPARYTLWALGFAPGASSYWVGDFDGDGRRDLGAQLGGTVQAALSRTTLFQQVGAWTGPAPVESSGPTGSMDVNKDGIPDQLSISPSQHLVVSIASTSGAVDDIELPDTWCASGDCLIGDMNGDGVPDLVDVARVSAGGVQAGDVWVSLGSRLPDFPVLVTPAPSDSDGDGVLDSLDDCVFAANPDQIDSDGDSFGNACDADLDNDGIVKAAKAKPGKPRIINDLSHFEDCVGADLDALPECATRDFNGDGLVDLNDYFGVFKPSTNRPPGPSAATNPPHIELAAPVDGTISSPGTRMAWVAGWVPDVPEGDVQVTVNGLPVPVSGPVNFFATFVDLLAPAGDTGMWHPILVEAIRNGLTGATRRDVIVGDRVASGERAHGAFGARMTASGLGRIQDYLNTTLAPKLQTEVPASLNHFFDQHGCATASVFVFPICWSGYEISKARMDSPPLITAALEDGTLHVHASITALRFDWRVDVDGPDCGDDANITNVEIDLRYTLQVGSDGRIEVRELQDPVVTADADIDGCLGFNGSIGDGAIGRIRDYVDQTQDYTIFKYPQKGPVAEAVEGVLDNLDASGTLGTAINGFDITVDYETRFESADLHPAGLTAWLGARLDAAPQSDGTDAPAVEQADFQIPYASVPSLLPSALPSGTPFEVGAAVTPNGLNELLAELTHGGVLAHEAFDITTTKLGADDADITAGILRTFVPEFKLFDPNAKFKVHVAPSAVPPVVSGRKGPGNEAVDVHVPQIEVSFVGLDNGFVALSVQFDARLGVIMGIDRTVAGGSGALTAFADGFELLDFAVIDNPLHADPAQVATKVLCVDANIDDPLACAISDTVKNGLDSMLAAVPLPTIANSTNGFNIVPQCLERLDDGTILAEFNLLLPGEPVPVPSRFANFYVNQECLLPPSPDPTGGGGGGVFDPGPGDPPPADTGSGSGGTSSGGGIGGGGGSSPDDPPLHQL